MLKSFSFLYSLVKIIFRNPWNLDLRLVFGAANSILQDMRSFLESNCSLVVMCP